MTLRSPIVRTRGAVLPSMLLVALSLLLVAASILSLVQADVAVLSTSGSIQQSRAIARSGLNAWGVELSEKRLDLLQGLAPDLPDRIELFDLPGGERIAVARLLPLGPGGERLVAEAGKLDLNTATAEMLSATGYLDSVEAEAVIAARDARPGGRFGSVLDLLDLEGDVRFDEARMYGELDELRVLSLVDADEEEIGERIADRLAGELGGEPRGLLDLFTVHAFEPNVRRDGVPRVLIGSEDTGESLDFEFAEAAEYLDQLQRSLTTTRNDLSARRAVIAEFLAATQSGEPWRAEALDSMTIEDAEWLEGRVDINSAPVQVLQAIPGLSPEDAAALVQFRENLDLDERYDLTWPMAEGVVSSEAWMASAVNMCTTRSLLWRARIVSGTVSVEDLDGPIDSPIALEVLYDCSVAPPRLVELRDVTSLELVARMLAAGEEFDRFEVVGPDTDSAMAAGNGLLDRGSMFDDQSYFDDASMFDDPSMFDDASMFDDPSMFDDASLFEDDSFFDDPSLFDNDPLFGVPISEPAGGPGGAVPDGPGPRGRWRPATRGP